MASDSPAIDISYQTTYESTVNVNDFLIKLMATRILDLSDSTFNTSTIANWKAG